MMLLSEASASSAHVKVELLVVTTTTTTTKRSSAATKETRENVVKVHIMELLASPRLPLHLFMLSHAFFTLLVIYSTFFLV